MAEFSDYYENWIIDHMLRNIAFTPPVTVYVALYTTVPTDAGGGVEVSGGAYARQAVTLSAASAGATSNSAAVTYPTATASWGTVVAYGIFDAVTVGNLLMWTLLDVSKAVASGDTAKFNIGDIDILVD